MYKLYGRLGWGSVLIEAQLVWYGLPYTLEEVDDLFKSAEAREKLAAVNPLAQVPTLVLPDGRIMTESAAITLQLADSTDKRPLVPSPGHATRPDFLRWLVFLIANIYPTYTYADDPSRFVSDAAAAKQFKASVDAYRLKLWGEVEGVAQAPWFLGANFSALDIYMAAMTHWTPRRPWFIANCPRATHIALATEALPELADVWKRNFPTG
jgi:GST-like protein